MQKIVSVFLVLVLSIVLTGCAKTQESATTNDASQTNANTQNTQNCDKSDTGDGDDQTITKKDQEEACAPIYRDSVENSYRNLQYRTSLYGEVPKEGSGLRLGVYQAQAAYGDGASEKNMNQLEEAVKEAKKYDVQLLSFPELYVPGYTLSSDDAKKVAEYKDGPSISKARQVAKANNMALLVPYAEKADIEGETKYFDSIAVINENGDLLDSYQKTHLYGQQERDNWSFGTSDYPVHAIFGFPVGVLNCYEAEFPELSRILALNGAKLIVAPTAADNYYVLPDGERSDVPYPDISHILAPANSYQNNIFFAYSNRAGYEKRGSDVWHYKGNSIVTGPYGDVLVEASHEQDTMLVSDVVPAFYGDTHPAPKYNYLQDRRPNLYGEMTSNEAKFYNDSEKPIDENTNLMEGGYTYPEKPE
ncbi:carbon-nitrogen hydrolase family protein [Patescibacteria group bacterium]|nr:carbon-nitrogen hydrolase family protein [Patescibacteria group bacterium]